MAKRPSDAAAAAPSGLNPEIFNPDSLPEVGAGIADMPSDEELSASAQKRSSSEGYTYKPSALTYERLEKLPWDEMSRELGLQKKNFYTKGADGSFSTPWKIQGVLEGLAYGTFTTYPVRMQIASGHQQSVYTMGTIRLLPKTARNDWSYEIHPVSFRFKLDEKGEHVLRENPYSGQPEYDVEIDRNALREGETLTVFGQTLTPQQMDHLRLTGHLGSLLSTKNNYQCFVSVDPFNNHTLIIKGADKVRESLAAHPEFRYKGRTYEVGDREMNAICRGEGAWLGDHREGGDNVYVQYSAAAGKIVPAVEFGYAKRREVSARQSDSPKEQQSRTQKRTPSLG